MKPDDKLVIRRLYSRGLSPAQIAVTLGYDLSEVIPYADTPRERTAADVDQLTQGMATFAWRAFEEGMRLLDEGTPAIKARLIGSAMGHTLRLLRTQSPREFDELRDEMSSILSSETSDGESIDSIYSTFDDESAVYQIVPDDPNIPYDSEV